jgi:hypothetical protein
MRALASQSILPTRWVIVADRCSDDTAEVARRFAHDLPYIRVLERTGMTGRNFASKVEAFRAGYRLLEGERFSFVGNLDADVTFGETFFRGILAEFHADPRLGVAGGWITEERRGRFLPRFGNSEDSVAGATLVARRRAFEEAGGFPPLRHGGEDAALQVAVRMRGWRVRSFPHLEVRHHKTPNNSLASLARARFLEGRRDHALGYDVVYEGAKCLRRAVERPFAIGGILRLAGYLSSLLRGEARPVSGAFVAFLRAEQRRRLRSLFGSARAQGTREATTPSSRACDRTERRW